ncbi:hypothetical protein Lal_00013172 [Lupinus albus]|nr:hypothetical protein Lal_00013172 [Lupinus albus]
MRRRPEEDDQEQQHRHQRDVARHRHPADQRRKGPRPAADDDVLRRARLQPHGIDPRVVEDRHRQDRRRQPAVGQPHDHDRGARQREAEIARGFAVHAPGRQWPLARALHPASISASHHWLSAAAPPAPTAMHRIAVKPSTGWMSPARRAGRTGRQRQGLGGIHLARAIVPRARKGKRVLRLPKGAGPGRCWPTPCGKGQRKRKEAPDRSGASLSGSGETADQCAALGVDHRQGFELVERRWAGQGPFQRRRAFAPVVGFGLLAGQEGIGDVDQEDHDADRHDHVAVGGDLVPVFERRSIVGIATRHAVRAQEVHREEDQVHADEEYPELQVRQEFGVHPAAHLREPVVEPGEERGDRAQRQHVVEVRHHVVGILQVVVDAAVGQHHAGHAADREQEDEADRPDHRRLEFEAAAPHRRDPREDLDAGGHRDDHGRRREVHLRVHVEAGGVHVVRPHDEADDADRDHGVSHAEVAEHRLLREGRDDLADDAEARQDHDIHFGMAEEPEQVLVQDRVTTAGRIEERRAEVAVRQQHGDRRGENRQRQQQQERGDQHRPHEQRHLVQGHARRAHVEDGAGARAVAHAARHEGREHQRAKTDEGQPERDVVHAREGHVRRADHDRNEPVAEAADDRRHDHEEHHDQAVRGDQHVPQVELLVEAGILFAQEAGDGAEILDARLGQFGAHDARHGTADDAREDREDQIERADVLVVGGHEPASEEARLVIVIVRIVVVMRIEPFVVCGNGGHDGLPLS